MATAGPVFQVAVFDPAATHVMGEAFDCACRSLRGIGQVGRVREIIAKRIIEVAREGERDPDRLSDYALHGLDFFTLGGGTSTEAREGTDGRSQP
jgi:hypothetical protein